MICVRDFVPLIRRLRNRAKPARLPEPDGVVQVKPSQPSRKRVPHPAFLVLGCDSFSDLLIVTIAAAFIVMLVPARGIDLITFLFIGFLFHGGMQYFDVTSPRGPCTGERGLSFRRIRAVPAPTSQRSFRANRKPGPVWIASAETGAMSDASNFVDFSDAGCFPRWEWSLEEHVAALCNS